MIKIIKKIGKLTGVCLLVCTILLTGMSSQLNADTALRDKNTNTAYITEKTAEWTSVEDYLAELTLKINGTEQVDSMDVVIVLDRSGSMDMNFIQEVNDGNGGTYGTHNASSPCLNQEHFYLKETTDIPSVIPSSEDDMYYDEAAQRLTVYNAEKKTWVVLDTSDRIHLYYQFGLNVADPDNLALAAYHFKHDGENFIRISEYDTTDTRKGSSEGIWDHADEHEGCYDRWIEAKKAVETFSDKLLAINEEQGLTGDDANTIALVPFSMRDETLVHRLNNGTKNYRDWLVQNNYFDDTGVTVESDGSLSGTYDSKVGWTDNASDISTALSSMFTTHTTDYVYGLSEAYNMLDARSAQAKANKDAVVIVLSDGTPDPATGTFGSGGNIYAFYNTDAHIYGLADAIKADVNDIITGSFWSQISGTYQRHSVDPSILAKDSSNNIIGAYGQDAEIITVGYMLDSQNSKDRLSNIASNSNYIDIPADAQGSTENYLSDKLLSSVIMPGGRNAVLRDEVSEYYYVPDDAVLPAGVTIEGTIEDGQTIVWEIGNIYKYTKENEPSITIPLVLKEEYRDVASTTYYPTNNDNPQVDLTTPGSGPDGEDTGAKLYYTDMDGNSRYDTIGTPKLPVYPKEKEKPVEPKEPETPIDPKEPEKPTPPIIEKPSIDTEIPTIVGKEVEDLLNIVMKPSTSPMAGDDTTINLYWYMLFIGISGVLGVYCSRRKYEN
jgi:hypothetical protein